MTNNLVVINFKFFKLFKNINKLIMSSELHKYIETAMKKIKFI